MLRRTFKAPVPLRLSANRQDSSQEAVYVQYDTVRDVSGAGELSRLFLLLSDSTCNIQLLCVNPTGHTGIRTRILFGEKREET